MNPATTACKRNRVGNLDTDRLRVRRYFLALTIMQNARQFDQRIEFAARAAELVSIERELVTRGALSDRQRVTTW